MIDVTSPTLEREPRPSTPPLQSDAGPSPLLRGRVAELVRMTRFAAIGATGTLVNLGVMAALIAAGGHYVVAAIVAAEVSIVGNFLLQERFVFDDRLGGSRTRRRFVQAVGFNNLEALARLPLLIGLVEILQLPEVLAQALTLAAAFLLRFTFMSRVVYRVPTPGRR